MVLIQALCCGVRIVYCVLLFILFLDDDDNDNDGADVNY